jgi:hypothetical protein
MASEYVTQIAEGEQYDDATDDTPQSRLAQEAL